MPITMTNQYQSSCRKWRPAASIEKTKGMERYTLTLEAFAALVTTSGGAALPVLTPLMILRWLGQMMNQTLNHMMVPKSIPREIQWPRLVWKSAHPLGE